MAKKQKKKLLKSGWLILMATSVVIATVFFCRLGRVKNDQITLERIFDQKLSKTDNFPKDQMLIFQAAGDTSFARMVNFKSTTQVNNYIWPVEKIKSEFKGADINLVNLETPLINNCPLEIITGKILCADSRHVESLTAAGINVVNIANNHIDDYPESAKKTIEVLEKNNIAVSGKKEPVQITTKRLKLAFLGFDQSGFHEKNNPNLFLNADSQKIIDSIHQAKKSHDIVVVSFHWGAEFTRKIIPEQRKLSHLAIDAGADIIVGTHPHWTQPIEIYKNKTIFYSLGNFVFTQNTQNKMNEGLVTRLIFYQKKLIDVELLPIFLNEYGQPAFVTGSEKTRIIEKLKQMSFENQKSSNNSY